MCSITYSNTDTLFLRKTNDCSVFQFQLLFLLVPPESILELSSHAHGTDASARSRRTTRAPVAGHVPLRRQAGRRCWQGCLRRLTNRRPRRYHQRVQIEWVSMRLLRSKWKIVEFQRSPSFRTSPMTKSRRRRWSPWPKRWFRSISQRWTSSPRRTTDIWSWTE